jgi:hypothetical protein
MVPILITFEKCMEILYCGHFTTKDKLIIHVNIYYDTKNDKYLLLKCE